MGFIQKLSPLTWLVKGSKPLRKTDVIHKLEPLIELHGIKVKENALVFPEYDPQTAILETGKETATSMNLICFQDIIYISETLCFLAITARSGFIYLLSKEKAKRAYLHSDTILKEELQEMMDNQSMN